ncbi:MAG: TraB/VirB10 family protein [Succinivibrionaceae bacterium]|nr:TraB/VirB10 family protein [Succinivibrionaceae bacterium]
MSRQLTALDEKYRHLTSENGMEYLKSKREAGESRQERLFADSADPRPSGKGTAGSRPETVCRQGETLADGHCVRNLRKEPAPPKERPEDQYFRQPPAHPKEGKRRIGVYTSGKESPAAPAEIHERARTQESRGLFLPAGSILSGVFINGMDAPTGQGAGKDHFPALVRISREAILPNRYRADIRECFLIVSGYGDLSSERAYLRGELISCITQDRKIIEGQLDAYVVGNDGFAGVRGRLVSKQGQIIAKSLMSGFLSGLAGAFDVKPVPTISTSSNGTVSYESIYSSKALQGAAATGISSSLGKVADFYLKLAESLYPVIEISAGRQVDVVVSKGAYLEAVEPGQSRMRSAVSEARRQNDQISSGAGSERRAEGGQK